LVELEDGCPPETRSPAEVRRDLADGDLQGGLVAILVGGEADAEATSRGNL
jgi:hypothetical protein